MKSSRLRSILTMIGVTVGVASITTILALSTGVTQIVGNQVDELGGNIAVVRPGASSPDNPLANISELAKDRRFATSTLSQADIAAIEALDNVSNVAPLMVLSGAVSGSSEGPSDTPIVATSPAFEKISDLTVQEGQFLDPGLDIKAAIVGPQLSVDLFGTEGAIGKTVRIKGQAFTVIGVLKRTNNPINYNGVNLDKSVLINLDNGRELNQGAAHIQQINVQSESVTQLEGVIVDINKTLLRTHLNEVDFTVLSGSAIAQPSSQMFNAIAGVSVAIAAISLFVGGIGIMNIMLVSVAERTREIGIRKALGATNGDIVSQFLIESLALSIGGGIAGYILAYALAFAISTFLTFDPAINWEIAVTAMVVSVVTGTVFGIYPAIRAARKDPISALRHYS